MHGSAGILRIWIANNLFIDSFDSSDWTILQQLFYRAIFRGLTFDLHDIYSGSVQQYAHPRGQSAASCDLLDQDRRRRHRHVSERNI